MPVTIASPRDLLLHLLGELLYVERRLADDVLRRLVEAVRDEELASALRAHLPQTAQHAERVETAFRRLEAAPSSNLSRSFESAVAQHDELAAAIASTPLADLHHAAAALRTEHWEIAAYETLLRVAPADVADLLRPSLEEEREAAAALLDAIGRLGAR